MPIDNAATRRRVSRRTTVPRGALVLLLALVTVLLVGCGGGDGESAVRDFSEVQASDFRFRNDETRSDRAIFHVTTTEPMICAIVWGPTEALGQLNNSLDMNGRGIREHNVFLPGAEAGETYFFQVQGSTADGTLFRSPLASFTLPEREQAGAATPETDSGGMDGMGEIDALDATIAAVSSEFSDTWAAENVLDGDLDTEWASAGDGDDAFITLDLGRSCEVTGVEFLTRSMADGSAVTQTYVIIVDEDERLGPFSASTPARRILEAAAFTGRRLRFELEGTTGGNTGAVEIRVFGP